MNKNNTYTGECNFTALKKWWLENKPKEVYISYGNWGKLEGSVSPIEASSYYTNKGILVCLNEDTQLKRYLDS